MTKTILMGASFLALLAAYPAFAADTSVDANANVSTSTKIENSLDKAGDKIKASADKAGNAIERAADKAKVATKDKYQDVKAYFNNDKDLSATSSINVSERNTADAIIGTGVQDANGKSAGKIHDIIVDKDGNAQWVIIEDGGVLGLGSKLVAFDYGVIDGWNKSNDAVVKLTEAQIKAAQGFEYEAPKNSDKKVTVLPADRYSVKKILDAKVIGTDGKKIADVDEVAFDGNAAKYLIVDFDKVLGMGGDKAALNMDALNLVNDNGKYSFKLDSQQTAQFENYKETTKAN